MKNQRLFGVTGWKNSGKTTLICKLVEEIIDRGFSVSTVKHAHHSFDFDKPGRDSHKHRMSGAQEVIVSSPKRWAILHELRGHDELSLDDLLAKLSPVDVVLVEGFKNAPHPKIECRRSQAASHLDIAEVNPTIVAIAHDHRVTSNLPDFDLNDTGALASFILAYIGLNTTDHHPSLLG